MSTTTPAPTEQKRTKINKAFKPLYTTHKRYILLTGGRGSLKSSTVHDFIARLTYEKGHGVLFTRYTMTSAKVSIIPEFKIVLDRLGITNDFYITSNIITNKKTGSFIYFSGIKTPSGDQTARLKSIAGITTWVIEEGEDFTSEKTFDTIDDSIRTTAQKNRVIWVQNPTTREHFLYNRFIANTNKTIKIENQFDVTVSTNPQVEHIHTTYKIAERLGYLSKDWLIKAEQSKEKVKEKVKKAIKTFVGSTAELAAEIRKIWHTSHYYYNYIGGWLERAEGVIFDNWEQGAFNYNLPSCYGLDFGYFPDPLAMPLVAVDKRNKKVYVKQAIYKTEIDDVAAYLEKLKINKRALIVADTNEPRTIQAIRKKGFNIVKAAKKQRKKAGGGSGSIVPDIRELKKYTIIVDPDSPDIKKELNNYVWNDKRASIPIDKYNHLIDAIRYAFRRLVDPVKTGVTIRN